MLSVKCWFKISFKAWASWLPLTLVHVREGRRGGRGGGEEGAWRKGFNRFVLNTICAYSRSIYFSLFILPLSWCLFALFTSFLSQYWFSLSYSLFLPCLFRNVYILSLSLILSFYLASLAMFLVILSLFLSRISLPFFFFFLSALYLWRQVLTPL